MRPEVYGTGAGELVRLDGKYVVERTSLRNCVRHQGRRGPGGEN